MGDEAATFLAAEEAVQNLLGQLERLRNEVEGYKEARGSIDRGIENSRVVKDRRGELLLCANSASTWERLKQDSLASPLSQAPPE